MSIDRTWSYPWEANRDTSELDNRFSTITEVRRVAWPAYEKPEWDAMNFLQGIAGTLELFHRSTLDFQKVACDVTGHPVAVFQRIDQAGYKLPIDERILADTDTLLVFGLDHLVAEQEALVDEIAAIREWLKREDTCLLIGPHHDVGFTADLEQRQTEYRHHGDELVPRQQRFGQYTRSLMKAFDVPVLNQFGLRPAVVKGTNQITPLTVNKDLDKHGLLEGVTTFNFHLHLPHYAVTSADEGRSMSCRDNRWTVAPASVDCCGQHGVQLLPLDATKGRTRGTHRDGRLDSLHDAVRWNGELGELLAKPGEDVARCSAM